MAERQFSSETARGSNVFFVNDLSSSFEPDISADIEENPIAENGDEDSASENPEDFHISRRVILVMVLLIVILSGTMILWSKKLSRKV